MNDHNTHRRTLRFSVKHLLALASFAAIVFATLQLPDAIAQAAIFAQVLIAFHMVIAKRLDCYESIFAGAVSAFIIGILFPHVSGSWSFGRPWPGMLEPLSMIRYFCMLGVGGFVQVQYADAHRRQELLFERDRRHIAYAYREKRRNHAMDTEPPN